MHGQVSVETIMAFAVLLLFFAMVLVYNASVQNSAGLFKEKFEEQKECLRLAWLISKAYSNGNGTEISFELAKHAVVFGEQRVVRVGQQYCGFLANAESKSLSAGNISLSVSDNKVLFS